MKTCMHEWTPTVKKEGGLTGKSEVNKVTMEMGDSVVCAGKEYIFAWVARWGRGNQGKVMPTSQPPFLAPMAKHHVWCCFVLL